MVKHERVTASPQALQLRLQVERRITLLPGLRSARRVRIAVQETNQLIERANAAPSPVHLALLPPLDEEAFVSRWRQAAADRPLLARPGFPHWHPAAASLARSGPTELRAIPTPRVTELHDQLHSGPVVAPGRVRP